MLNQITPAQIARYKRFYVPGAEAKWTPFRRHRHAYLLGLLANLEGDMAGLRRHFREAAVQGVALLETRIPGEITGGDAIRQLEIPLMTAAAFGDLALRGALAALPRALWFLPESKPELGLAEGFEALRHLAAEQPVEAPPLESVPNEAPEDSLAPPFGWAHPLARAILGILRGDAGELHRGCASLLDGHEHEARAGRWTRVPEGLVALWPLALEAVARRRGVTAGVTSPYLPLAALDVPAPADDDAASGT
ncbi:MAG: immunity 49 family protein [Thiohalocapsa sp.]|jgi:hypothetical protein|uniref:Imm49 family immunity protein n=1 Tax=Thiohalocapsa sp. TaxID=2497641 RepID=UPI0025DF0041|nr:Imm49 family immunity protein [Thiohalocapsa sp.]MCG6942879.1 immunity 49 family protein [Thiohalocapsa sp.]